MALVQFDYCSISGKWTLQVSEDTMRLRNIVASLFGMLWSLHCHLVMSETISYPEPGNHNLLAADLFHTLVASKSSENILFSPIPAEIALTTLFANAKGKTADELRHALRLGTADTNSIQKNFTEFLKNLLQSNFEAKTSYPEFFMANRIYVSDKLKISPNFNRLAEESFKILAENANFAESKSAVEKINNFVQRYTNNKVKNLLQEDDINAQSNMIVANGLYFKGKWKYSFNEKYTKLADFQLNEKEKTAVQMMNIKGAFNYIDLPELEAAALELPYDSPELTMLIILPYKIEGLKKLEEKLKDMEFNYIPSRLAAKNVCARIPKFQAEHKIDLKPALERIGLPTIFSKKAEFPGMFESPADNYFSNFKQKILFEIDEFGSEPANDSAEAECGKDFASFNVDHPFIYGVRSNSAVYFAGHIATCELIKLCI